jgi:signal transduction histidine kinase
MEAKEGALESAKEFDIELSGEVEFFDSLSKPIFHGTENSTKVESINPDVENQTITKETLKIRHDVLESIYSIVTSSSTTQKDIYNKIVVNIAQLLNVPFVSIGKKTTAGKTSCITRFNSGVCDSFDSQKSNCAFCSNVFNSKAPSIINNDLCSSKINCNCLQNVSIHSYLGVPIVSGSNDEFIGTICIVDTQFHKFSKEQIHLVEIFSRYIANEFDRESIQRELLQSQEMKILGVLTSGVAHEVRNPLNAIWAITEALFQEINSDSRLNVYRDHIKSQVERLSLLMQELLDLGKPFSSKDAALVPIPLLCKKTIELWSQTDSVKRTVKFINTTPEEDGLVKGDYHKLQQVIMNLLDNASQHSSSTCPITVHFYLVNSTCHIDITDYGCGISKEIHSKIFNPFFTTRAKGTGLGLPIVKNIVDIHGGSIELYNNDPPPGITAAICLPAAVSQIQTTCKTDIPKESILPKSGG